jgi:hypothetical protein
LSTVRNVCAAAISVRERAIRSVITKPPRDALGTDYTKWTEPNLLDDGIDDTFVSVGTTSGSMRGETLAKRECERLQAGVEKLDLESSIDNWLRLSDELIEPLLAHNPVTALVDVKTLSGTRWLAVDRHAETYRAL